MDQSSTIRAISFLNKDGWDVTGFSDEDVINLMGFGREITVFIKETGSKNPYFKIPKVSCDYALFINDKGCYIIPKELFRNVDNPPFTYKKLLNQSILLKLTATDLLGAINDAKIRFSEILTTKVFFCRNFQRREKKSEKIKQKGGFALNFDEK